jgi:hypothetical protein
MNTKIRECVKKVAQNQEIDKRLPEYVQYSLEIHDAFARLRFAMEYFTFFEVLQDADAKDVHVIAASIEVLNHQAQACFSDSQESFLENSEMILQELLAARDEVTERMKVLTAYIDQFVVYESVLNHLQYRFDPMGQETDDALFTRQILDYIFRTKDNAAVNENIRSVVGQLPVRMTRGHFFELIQGSFSIYKGSDQAALEGFDYQLRTAAMLYQTDGMKFYFCDIANILQQFANLDFDHMQENEYRQTVEKLKNTTNQISKLSDLYLLLQQLYNEMCTIVLTKKAAGNTNEMQITNEISSAVNAIFRNVAHPIWGDADTQQEKLHCLEERFVHLEGQQERVYDAMNLVDAILEETMQAQASVIDAKNLRSSFSLLPKLAGLASDSLFVNLKEPEMLIKEVSGQEVDDFSCHLMEDLKEKFHHSGRLLKRAIMANVLEKLPLFFHTPQEVADYISHAWEQCDDVAEKYVSKLLLQDMISK